MNDVVFWIILSIGIALAVRNFCVPLQRLQKIQDDR